MSGRRYPQTRDVKVSAEICVRVDEDPADRMVEAARSAGIGRNTWARSVIAHALLALGLGGFDLVKPGLVTVRQLFAARASLAPATGLGVGAASPGHACVYDVGFAEPRSHLKIGYVDTRKAAA